MLFSYLYSETISLWQCRIFIGDCYMPADDTCFCPSLSQEWKRVRRLSCGVHRDWHNLMCWSIFTEIHRVAELKVLNEEEYVFLSEIDIRNIEKKLYEVLSEPEWEDYLKVYVNDLEVVS